MTSADFHWASRFQLDVDFGFVDGARSAPGRYTPRVVLNGGGSTVEHALVEELRRADAFTFSVAFISSGAIAQLKQHLLDFKGAGTIVTSDFLGFNDPKAFGELLNLKRHLGLDVRRHTSSGFHAKGYVFDGAESITAMVGSSNLTNSALSENYEWNLKVSAAKSSDLARQITRVLADQYSESEPITREWVEQYASTYRPRTRLGAPGRESTFTEAELSQSVSPNDMQQDALLALDLARARGDKRAIVISATGTGKTMLSALDVRAMDPRRMLFVAHREQILARTIREYRWALGGPASDFGLLTGSYKQTDRRYLFATVQTLSQERILQELEPETFDYVIVDEAHRAGAPTYQRVIDHFKPEFLLGMTATPERTDGFNVFDLFHYNVPYEIRLAKALEARMLAPFHYYGVADVAYEDETLNPEEAPLGVLISTERVDHLVRAIDLYGQADTQPRGLIFCSRVDEARKLSEELNKRQLRGRLLRTAALSGEDSIADREGRAAELESGALDYILTVDVFNEGVDIPSLNQVVMLRQTKSAIVFVQQLGRGLRLAELKDYLVVIDFIGNYANNFLIPIALFGDESLNRESLRERLNETVEAGALPGLSSVSFDEIARDRVLKSIGETQLDSLPNLKSALVAMRDRVGATPQLWDFYRFRSVDPVLLATRIKEHYPALVQRLLGEPHGLDGASSRALSLLSNEVLPAKRLHEFELMGLLLARGSCSLSEIIDRFESTGLPVDGATVGSAIDTLTLVGYAQSDVTRYQNGLAVRHGKIVELTRSFAAAYSGSERLRSEIADLLMTGKQLTQDRYQRNTRFTPGMQYSRRDAARLIGWARSVTSTIYGVKVDEQLGVCAIFVTLHKSDDVAASTAYQDRLLDPTTMLWFTKSNRTLESKDVRGIVSGAVEVHVFVKKDDAEGADHYYLGRAVASEAQETTMPGDNGSSLPVVTMLLRFDAPIKQGLFDYFGPGQSQHEVASNSQTRSAVL